MLWDPHENLAWDIMNLSFNLKIFQGILSRLPENYKQDTEDECDSNLWKSILSGLGMTYKR